MMYYMYALDVNLSDIPYTQYAIKHLWVLLQLLRADSATIQDSGRLPTVDFRREEMIAQKARDMVVGKLEIWFIKARFLIAFPLAMVSCRLPLLSICENGHWRAT